MNTYPVAVEIKMEKVIKDGKEVIEPTAPRQEAKGGTHASPRQHDRRGHLRRLKSGKNVWVKPHKVGDPSKGVVFHDYRILEAA